MTLTHAGEKWLDSWMEQHAFVCWMRHPSPWDVEKELISDISTLYNLITTRNELTDVAQRRILFALEYFYDSDDDIPDKLPWVGYLDDAVVTRWVLEGLIADYGKYFDM